MPNRKTRNWQEAINAWDRWQTSIKEARGKVEQEYGNISELMKVARFVCKERVSKGSKRKIYSYVMNDAMEKIWNIDDILKSIAKRFVTKEMGLRRDSDFHSILSDFWMECAYPEFRKASKEEIVAENEALSDSKHMLLDSKWYRKTDVIENSITWRHGQVELSEIANALMKLKEWPFDENEIKHGDNTEKEKTADINAIICYAFRYKQKLTEEQIGKMYDLVTYPDHYGKQVGTTIKKRLARGRKLMQQHGTSKIGN